MLFKKALQAFFMGKISPEEKIQWVEKIIQNKESISSVASKTGIHYMTIDIWVRNYKTIGQEAFFRKGWIKRTSVEKEAAVLDYLVCMLIRNFFAMFSSLSSHHKMCAGFFAHKKTEHIIVNLLKMMCPV